MNCNQAIELLPWLANGTLEAGERQEVRRHLAGCAACREALADTRTAWEIFDWHPPAAALIAQVQAESAAAGAARGHASPATDALADHLATCPSCAAELELLRTSRALADPATDERVALLPRRRPEDAAARRAWRRSALAAGVVGLLACTGWFESARQERALERRLRETSAAGRSAAASGAATSSGTSGTTAASGATAPGRTGTLPPGPGAADLRRRADQTQAQLQGLERDNQQLQQKVADLARGADELQRRSDRLAAAPASPAVESAALAEVHPVEQVERGSGEPAETVVPLSSGAASLLLDTRRSDRFPAYEIEVHDAQDRPVGGAVRVQPHFGGGQGSSPPDGFDIVLRRRALPPGAYSIHLFGRASPANASEKGRVPLGTYSIRVS